MFEILAVGGGAVVGLIAMQFPAGRSRGAIAVAGCLIVALLASGLSGELAESIGFLFLDAAFAAAGALLTAIAWMRFKRREREPVPERSPVP